MDEKDFGEYVLKPNKNMFKFGFCLFVSKQSLSTMNFTDISDMEHSSMYFN